MPKSFEMYNTWGTLTDKARQSLANTGVLLQAYIVPISKGKDMTIQSMIEQKLNHALSPVHLEVVNESHMHSVPEGSESHFKVTAVSDKFEEQPLLNRHRLINETLSQELSGNIHALSITALTPEEWFERSGEVSDSPPCLGGSKFK